jgi:hypothetical protein
MNDARIAISAHTEYSIVVLWVYNCLLHMNDALIAISARSEYSSVAVWVYNCLL